MNIILTGPRGVGKTRKGKLLAESLGYKFIDSDELLEERNHTTISEIVKEKGWEEFRKLENENIKYLISRYKENVVLALGGGAIASNFEELRKDNLKRLKKYGKIILLYPTKDIEKNVKVLLNRITLDKKTKKQRPLLTNLDMKGELIKTLKERDSLYKEASDEIVYTMENKEDEIIKDLVDYINSF